MQLLPLWNKGDGLQCGQQLMPSFKTQPIQK